MEALAYQLPKTRSTPVNTLVVGHLLFGAVAVFAPVIVPVYLSIFFIYSLLQIVRTQNKDNYAAYAVAYLCAAEMLLRLSRYNLIYEFGKYTVITFLTVGMIVEPNKRTLPSRAFLYFALLIPSIFVAKYPSFYIARTAISFNLTGPLCIAISWMYFVGRKFDKENFQKLMTNLILPSLAVIAFILLKIPSDTSFLAQNTQSSKATSGGFGPNQVSSALGGAFFFMAVSILMKVKITFSRRMDFVFAFIFLGFSLFTFSRGGVLTGILALLGTVYVFIRQGRASKQAGRIFFGVIFFGLAGYFLWQFLDNITGSRLSERYENTVNQQKENKGKFDVSGRDVIFMQDLEAFASHPILGNGPAGSTEFRTYKYNSIAIAHIEYTRLLGDHGLFGLFALIVLLSSVVGAYRKSAGDNQIIMIGFFAICLLTMFHAALRLSVPALCFGLAMIDVDLNTHPLAKAIRPPE
jgi:hypothetical protein